MWRWAAACRDTNRTLLPIPRFDDPDRLAVHLRDNPHFGAVILEKVGNQASPAARALTSRIARGWLDPSMARNVHSFGGGETDGRVTAIGDVNEGAGVSWPSASARVGR